MWETYGYATGFVAVAALRAKLAREQGAWGETLNSQKGSIHEFEND